MAFRIFALCELLENVSHLESLLYIFGRATALNLRTWKLKHVPNA